MKAGFVDFFRVMMLNLLKGVPLKGAIQGLLFSVIILLVVSCQPVEQSIDQVLIIDNPSETSARFPSLASLPDGAVLMSWTETFEAGHVLKFAVFKQGEWFQQGEVAQGTGWFVNWADFPAVTPIDQTFWVAHWQVRSKSGRSHEHDIMLSISVDAGATWSRPQMPYRPDTAAGHGFVAIFPVENAAGVVWLDESDHESGRTSLRYTRLHRDGRLDTVQVIDKSTCTCCWVATAITATGPVIAWRSRRDHEVRDHHIALLNQANSTTPSSLSQEKWSIEGCPVNGPALAAQGDKLVASWYTAENNRPRVRVAFSDSDPLQFRAAIDVDADKPSGRIKVAWLNDHTAFITWMTSIDRITKKASLAGRKLFTDGTMGPVMRLVDINPGRDSGIPQLVKHDSGFMLAWTNGAPNNRVQTILLPLELGNQ